MHRLFFILQLCAILVISCSGPSTLSHDQKILAGKRITLDPGHGDTKAYDRFRIGPSGEREEWINLRVAKTLEKKLRRAGAQVLLTRQTDKDLSLGGRATLAKIHGSHLFVSIHHNGSGNDPNMDLPIVYFFGDARINPASVDFAKILLKAMRDKLQFEQQDAGAAYSDHLIYSSGTSVLRNTVAVMPGVIGEGGFFTSKAGEKRLKSRSYNKLEAEVYYDAILEYFTRGYPTARPVLLDTVKFIIPGQVIEFELDDGFGGTGFADDFAVLQGEDSLNFHWNPETGILSAQTRPSDEHEISLRVFGRNQRGNALHPRVFKFDTQSGVEWKVFEFWEDAFNAAEARFGHLSFSTAVEDTSQLTIVEEALQLYQLSLELQIVHAKARVAEENILILLELKQRLSGEDLSTDILAQRQRLDAYYP